VSWSCWANARARPRAAPFRRGVSNFPAARRRRLHGHVRRGSPCSIRARACRRCASAPSTRIAGCPPPSASTTSRQALRHRGSTGSGKSPHRRADPAHHPDAEPQRPRAACSIRTMNTHARVRPDGRGDRAEHPPAVLLVSTSRSSAKSSAIPAVGPGRVGPSLRAPRWRNGSSSAPAAIPRHITPIPSPYRMTPGRAAARGASGPPRQSPRA
jgi:hypothetical protein